MSRAIAIILLSCAVGLVAAPAVADEVAAEAAWKARPSAALAQQAAKAWLDKGQYARAANWVERMVRSPGVTAEQQAWAVQVRTDLKWRLTDMGYGQTVFNIRPADARVTVDGKELLPRGAQHLVWLMEGSHQVTVNAADHVGVDQFITVVRGERREQEFFLTNVKAPILILDVSPACEVFIDRVRAGASTKQRFATTPGSHMLELKQEGYVTFLKTLDLAAGDERKLTVQLVRREEDTGKRPVASNVDRPLLERELTERGESGPNLGEGPQVDSPLNAGSDGRVHVSRDAKDRSDVSKRPVLHAPDRAADAPPPPAGNVDAPFASAPDGEVSSASSAPWSASTKGWMLAGPGLALLAGGAYYTISSVRAAEKVNQDFEYGDPSYEAAYAAAAQKAYVGYAALGTGALLTGWGGYHLLFNKGLSRSGRGVLLSALGAGTLGAAAWMFLGARAEVLSAADFEATHPEYDRRTSVGNKDLMVSYGVGGAGLLAVGAGVYFLLTDNGRSASAEPADRGARWVFLPRFASGYSGGALQLAW